MITAHQLPYPACVRSVEYFHPSHSHQPPRPKSQRRYGCHDKHCADANYRHGERELSFAGAALAARVVGLMDCKVVLVVAQLAPNADVAQGTLWIPIAINDSSTTARTRSRALVKHCGAISRPPEAVPRLERRNCLCSVHDGPMALICLVACRPSRAHVSTRVQRTRCEV